MVIRYNDFKIDRFKMDPDTGFLDIEAGMARIGVQVYATQDGFRRELRPEKEVQDSVETFRLATLTLNHPETGVDSTNFKDVAVGIVPDAAYDRGVVNTNSPLKIQDDNAIAAAASTHQQLSAGYRVDLVDESGIWKDEFGVQGPVGAEYAFDAVQTNIRVNHVALVERGRAGAVASLKFDDGQIIGDDDNKLRELIRCDEGIALDTQVEPVTPTKPKEDINTMPITIDGKEYNETQVVDLFHTIKQDHATALASANEASTTAQTKADETSGLLLAANKTIEEQKVQIEGLKSDEDIQNEIAARLDAWMTALPVLEVEKADYSLTVASVEKLVVEKLASEMSLDGMSDATIHGLYLGLMANRSTEAKKVDTKATETKAASNQDDSIEAFRKVIQAAKPVTDSEANKEFYNQYTTDLENAWKLPTK